MPHLYFAPWQWYLDADEAFGGYWAAPLIDQIIAVQDWRSLTSQGTPTIASGHGLFAYPTTVVLAGSLYLGDDPIATMRPAQRDALGLYLGITNPLPSGNLAEILHYINTEENDPTGATRWSGRRMTRQGIGVSLPGFGELIRYEYDEAHPAWATSVQKFQAAYRRRRAAGEGLDALRLYTGATMLGLIGQTSSPLAERLLPNEYQGDGWQRPTSTFADDFTDTDGVDLTAHTPSGTNAGTSWTVVSSDGAEIVGNVVRAVTVSQSVHMVMSDALSSDAMDTQLTVVTLNQPDSGQNSAGPQVRMLNNTTITQYYTRLENTGAWSVEVGQRVEDVKTQLGQTTDRGDPGVPTVVKLSVNDDASVLEVFLDAVSEISVDDSTSEVGVGNVNGGFYEFARPDGPASDVEIDDFSTTDNLAGSVFDYRKVERIVGRPIGGGMFRGVY